MDENIDYLEALIKGSNSGIKRIYEQCFENVKKYIVSNGGQLVDAEDVFQRVLLEIAVRYRKEKFEIKSDFKGYLFVACRNSWIREIKRSKKRVTSELKTDLIDRGAEELAIELLEQKRWEMFQEGFAQLSAKCREILKLYFAKVPYSKIMDDFNYSSETVVRQRVFKCNTKLKEIIKKNKNYDSLKEL
ncbi:MAG: sigma-70 family RNA polymerase sigma factor [Cyclobacteriaceae bacterium]